MKQKSLSERQPCARSNENAPTGREIALTKILRHHQTQGLVSSFLLMIIDTTLQTWDVHGTKVRDETLHNVLFTIS